MEILMVLFILVMVFGGRIAEEITYQIDRIEQKRKGNG